MKDIILLNDKLDSKLPISFQDYIDLNVSKIIKLF